MITEPLPPRYYFHSYRVARGTWRSMIVEWSGIGKRTRAKDFWESPEYDEQAIAEAAAVNWATRSKIQAVKATDGRER